MFYLLIHPFHRHQIILLELWNSPRRHIVAAFREIHIQQAGGEKVNGEEKRRGLWQEALGTAACYLMRNLSSSPAFGRHPGRLINADLCF